MSEIAATPHAPRPTPHAPRPTPHAPRLCVIFAVLTFPLGCSPKKTFAPGETFSAGYVFAPKQSRITHDFVVRNTSAETVKILKIDKNCGCTSFNLQKFQLAPSESTKLTVSVDVPAAYMPKSAACILRTDHPRFRDWVYSVEFVSLPFIMADPDVLSLGSFNVDGSGAYADKNVTLDVFADSKVELIQENFTVPAEIKLEISPNTEVRRLQQNAWNTRYHLSIGLSQKGKETVLHTFRSGVVTKAIDVTVGESRRWSYSVYWQMLPPLVSQPSFLSFGNLLDDKDDHCRSITIRSTTKQKFKILSTKNQSPDVLFKCMYNPSNEAASQRLKIMALRPKDSSSRFLTGSIQIETTAKVQPTVEIHW